MRTFSKAWRRWARSPRQDIGTRQRCWFEGTERHYPLGLTDPVYCVLRFIAHQASYYHGPRNVTFTV